VREIADNRELTDRVGEIIEASSTGFTAESYELYRLPPLGSLVKTGDGETGLYGIVHHATTGSLEPGRRPLARGKDEASEEDVYRTSPQLLKLLKSEFSVVVVGHRQAERLNHYLPPCPARIHGFVYRCGDGEIKEFGQGYGFLNILVSAQLPVSTEELVAAALRQMSRAQEDPRAFLVGAGKELAVLLGGQFHQLKAILGRLQ